MNFMFVLTMADLFSGGDAQNGGIMGWLPMMLIFIGIFYFMLIRPQQRKEKEHRQLIDNIKSGERIMFSGGILGTVTNVKEGVFVVKIADNVKIEIARGAVIKVLEKGDKIETEEGGK